MSRLNLSIFIAASALALSKSLDNLIFVALILGSGYPHVLLGLRYSQRGLKEAWQSQTAKIVLLLIVPLGLLAPTFDWNVMALMLYFGLHHAISETFFGRGRDEESAYRKPLMVLLLFVSYTFSIKGNFYLPYLAKVGLAAVGTVSFFWILFLSRGLLKRPSERRDFFNRESWVFIGPALAVIANWAPVDWKVYILYHFAFYAFLPLLKEGVLPKEKLKKFWMEGALWNGLGIILFLTVALQLRSSGGAFEVVWIASLNLFYGLTYIHISWSFLISGANPSWIRRLLLAGRSS